MQLGHLALASKQPAMTASALAAAVEKGGDDRRAVELSAGVFRSQAAATLGNVLVGLPFAVFVDLLVRLATGHPMLGAETAAETLAGLHPWRSFTVLFAALTGVLLWAGSLVAGWAANWSAYRRLPEAVATSPELVRLVGAARAEAVGEFLRRHFGGLSGNVALGFLLGFTPSLLKFFGIPFEVRHVTLSACSTGLSLGSQWGHGAIDAGAFLTAVLGVAVIGVLNISVSFLLALWTAARARGLGADSWRTLKADVFRAFRREPGRFLLPPAGAGASPA
ncbi:gliding motility protein, partial [Acidobacteria bacterium ACD]|nr:gliding motility protein [Acidobacteria bacterium ACD]